MFFFLAGGGGKGEMTRHFLICHFRSVFVRGDTLISEDSGVAVISCPGTSMAVKCGDILLMVQKCGTN